MSVRPIVPILAGLMLTALAWSSQAVSALAQEGPTPPAAAGPRPPRPPPIRGTGDNTPTFPGPPAGMKALDIDMFTSKNFYKDQKSWTDKRYFRCNTPRQIMEIWTAHRIGPKPPTSASWGDCGPDFPRDRIVSHYPYKTAKEHYEALMAQAKAHGGPTVYTKATTPDWDGYYTRAVPTEGEGEWMWGTVNQTPTILSLLTPEYQTRMVQMAYHEAVDNDPQFTASFCYPEGFLRWWSFAAQGGNFQLIMTPWNVQFLSGIAANFLRQVLIGKQHVQKVPQWYGETIGFWDGESLVTWTANVQAWTLTHSLFDFSGKMETVEIFKPYRDASGKFLGLEQESVFYDPEAFVQPLRTVYHFQRLATQDDPNRRFTYVECLTNIRNVEGRPVQVTKADPRFIDFYGRPWAQNWEQYFEKGWDKPQTSNAPQDVLDLFK